MSGEALALAAQALVGARFRLHGRNPATGLDCVGVLAAALAAIGRRPILPNGYAMRTREPADLGDIARRCGLVPAAPAHAPGDVMLVRVGACQHHLLIAVRPDRFVPNRFGPDCFVHAHAGLRRVAVLDGGLPWPIVGCWRLPESC